MQGRSLNLALVIYVLEVFNLLVNCSRVFLQDALISAIASLPELRELSLEKLKDCVKGTLLIRKSDHPDFQNPDQAGFIDSVLAGLASCRSLKVLKLFNLHDKVTLTR